MKCAERAERARRSARTQRGQKDARRDCAPGAPIPTAIEAHGKELCPRSCTARLVRGEVMGSTALFAQGSSSSERYDVTKPANRPTNAQPRVVALLWVHVLPVGPKLVRCSPTSSWASRSGHSAMRAPISWSARLRPRRSVARVIDSLSMSAACTTHHLLPGSSAALTPPIMTTST